MKDTMIGSILVIDIKCMKNNIEHITNMNTWIELQIKLRKKLTIDKSVQKQISKEN